MSFYDPDNNVIYFRQFSGGKGVNTEKAKNYIIQMIHDRSNIPFMINRFFIEKCGAEPVDYHYFRSLESSVNE